MCCHFYSGGAGSASVHLNVRPRGEHTVSVRSRTEFGKRDFKCAFSFDDLTCLAL